MGRLQEKLDHLQAWDTDARVEQAMDALRCPPPDAEVSVLSGGERRRVALCRLLSRPDLLLLDQPANDLDTETLASLEDALGEFAGAVFGTYGPFWVIVGAFDTIYASSVPPVAANDANSLLLAVFAVITFYLGIASLRTDLVLTVIIWLIFAGLVVLSAGAGANNVDITEAGGWIVLAFAVLAWYHAAGSIIEFAFGRKILPTGPAPLR